MTPRPKIAEMVGYIMTLVSSQMAETTYISKSRFQKRLGKKTDLYEQTLPKEREKRRVSISTKSQ